MATTSNPFEPPRTTDLDGGVATGTLVLSEEALHELIAAAPSVRLTQAFRKLRVFFKLWAIYLVLSTGMDVLALLGKL